MFYSSIISVLWMQILSMLPIYATFQMSSYTAHSDEFVVSSSRQAKDMTSNLQEALSNNKSVRLNSGTYFISSALRLRRDQTLRLAPGVTLIQRARQQSAFVAIGAENLRIEVNGAIIRGPGGWSRAWTGMQGQEGSQGIRLIGCSGCSISGPGKIEGWGSAAISIVGGRGIRVAGLTIRGTAQAERMPSNGNNQVGIYVGADPSGFANYGAASDVAIDQVAISGVAQGVLREAFPGLRPTGPTTITGLSVDNGPGPGSAAPGQHGIYNQDSFLTVRNSTFRSLYGSAVKVQSGDARRLLSSVDVSGVEALDIGGALFELGTIYPNEGGVLSDIKLAGKGRGVGYGITINGRLSHLSARIAVANVSGNAAYVFGSNVRDAAVAIEASNVVQEPIVVTARNSSLTFDAAFSGALNSSGLKEGAVVRVTEASAAGRRLDTEIRFTRLVISGSSFGTMSGILNNTCDSIVRIDASSAKALTGRNGVRGTGSALVLGLPAGGQTTVSRRPVCR